MVEGGQLSSRNPWCESASPVLLPCTPPPCSEGPASHTAVTAVSTQRGGHPLPPPPPLPSRLDAFLPLRGKRRGLDKDCSKVWEETVMVPDVAGPSGLTKGAWLAAARWGERACTPAAPRAAPAVGSSGGGRARQQRLVLHSQPGAPCHQPSCAAAHLSA